MARLLAAVNRFSSTLRRLPIFERVQPLWNAAAACLPLDLSKSDSTLFINLELTARCNLRCVYCEKSFPEGRERVFDFPDEWIGPCMDILQRRGLWLVSAHGVGESTVRKGWQNICRGMLDSGVNLTIVSNFARPLRPEDTAILIHFRSILVSLDTADPELFARIRRGARLDTLIMNIGQVQERAKAEGVQPPEIDFDIVVTDKTIFGSEALVELGLKCGISTFYFNDLCRMPDIEGAIHVHNATALPKEQLAEGLACLKRAMELAKRAGRKVECQAGLLDGIQSKLQESTGEHGALPVLGQSPSWAAPRVVKGTTRDCTLPWETAYLSADGPVRPCCRTTQDVGDLRTETLEEILNGPKLRKFREDLLSGNLEGGPCMHCPAAPQVPVAEFRRHMSGRLALYSLRRRILNLFH